jgi:predicted phosphodiesterase
MKLCIFGDIHGDFKKFNNIINNISCDTVIQIGDFGYFPNLKSHSYPNNINTKKSVYFIDGNHEDHISLQELVNLEIYNDVKYIPRGSILELNGTNILCIGGAASIDKQFRTFMVDWFPQEEITMSDYYKIPKDVRIDIVLSHTSPMEFVLPNLIPFHDNSRNILSQILKEYKPKKWWFGHFHMNVENKFIHECGAETEWVCLSHLQNIKKEKYYEIIDI